MLFGTRSRVHARLFLFWSNVKNKVPETHLTLFLLFSILSYVNEIKTSDKSTISSWFNNSSLVECSFVGLTQ